DKEGFLRSDRSLIQTIGRAARNVNGKAILYADKITRSMRTAIDETERRRAKQMAHNERMGIVPQALNKKISDILDDSPYASKAARGLAARKAAEKEGAYHPEFAHLTPAELAAQIKKLEKSMYKAAKELDFEEAAVLRDQIKQLKGKMVGVGDMGG
ncbi:MAG: UvrB/UvrC motif-containing protein, partial [Gammaproteobacteria bacterium]|nr:UvrB/UvrC motif-containing protein [Gammaproteobacteria bacterium]